METATRIEELVKGVVGAEGLELVHIEYQRRGLASLLRIYVDKPGGINLDDCQKLSKQVSVLLDVEDFIPRRYVLEVSSPGIERPLFKEADYERFRNKEVRLQAKEKIDGRRNFTGHIRNFSGGTLELECNERVYTIPFQKIRRAHLVCRFEA